MRFTLSYTRQMKNMSRENNGEIRFYGQNGHITQKWQLSKNSDMVENENRENHDKNDQNGENEQLWSEHLEC